MDFFAVWRMFWCMVYAEMSYKAAVWLAITGGYAVIIE